MLKFLAIMHNSSDIVGFLKRQGAYILLLAIMLGGSASLGWARLTVRAQIAEAEETARPADISIILVTDPSCTDCFDAGVLADHVASGPINITERTEIDHRTDAGIALKEKYGLTRIPALILSGETDKKNAASFLAGITETVAGSELWVDIPPIYMDLESGYTLGRVSLTLLDDESCDECYDPAIHRGILENNFGLTITDVKTVDVSDSEGRGLVSKYGIQKVPTAIISSDATVYRDFTLAFPRVGDVTDDGSFVFRKISIFGKPYLDLTTGTVVDPTEKTNKNE